LRGRAHRTGHVAHPAWATPRLRVSIQTRTWTGLGAAPRAASNGLVFRRTTTVEVLETMLCPSTLLDRSLFHAATICTSTHTPSVPITQSTWCVSATKRKQVPCPIQIFHTYKCKKTRPRSSAPWDMGAMCARADTHLESNYRQPSYGEASAQEHHNASQG
jgi:hypothetical protein